MLQHLTLANGLRVSLHAAPQLKRCAAALRVAAGNHDVAAQWPGLAHFLEHLFFLGSERFPAADGLMRYVQRHGGQVNASTRERTTDYFFEVPVAAFAGGLERLCDMLAHPRLAPEDQLREREVLHAEFIAWSRDAAAQQQFALLQQLSAAHPLRGFHAGNRYSLPVPRPDFQCALQQFRKRYYQAGQMTLSLAGPQPLEALEALARQFGALFPSGERVQQPLPPPLLDDVPTQALLFACEELPDGIAQAIDFLSTWLTDEQPGGLVAQMREQVGLQRLICELLYQFAGQALLHIRFEPASLKDDPTAIGLLYDWLAFFQHAKWQPLEREYALLRQRKLATGSALELARLASEHYGEGENVTRALPALVQRMLNKTVQRIAPDIPWRLPAPNPFLQTAAAPLTTAPCPEALTLSDALPAQGEWAAVYLRWQLHPPLQSSFAKVLEHALQGLVQRARQAGVELSFSACGAFWQLKCSGVAAPIAAVLQEALNVLRAPPASSWQGYGEADHTPPLMPIRALIQRLPEALLSESPRPTESPNRESACDALNDLWATARWHAMATGLSTAQQAQLFHVLSTAPGQAQANFTGTPPLAFERQWRQQTLAGSEQAVLLFYPGPEALWRLLAYLLQGPFYQRLRVELQLGYAVFSAFRQLQGLQGIVFGVQSPSATTSEIVAHIQDVLNEQAKTISAVDLSEPITALSAQFESSAMTDAEAAERAWQSLLGGRLSDSPATLQDTLKTLDSNTVSAAAQQLTQACHGVLCLANGQAPNDLWRPPR
ncbi:pyrroloquinoline quinone biosynthesis protein PqqF [Pseudomonas sp. R5(2019)]|uniref:pyrroloquinoline quinone biosynthesis protein PqqF n=1 Tax=Pseudomonas sp. R5(2019) TaxID=2697566 RepID=UPI001411C291|nr:pyrroloquinoline quinone biosynthesis protein PqqF [Pseudomonas sp. R5(2019)]NBA96346.1 pyrroloquinoline quinone biosynthesis protein PqqF [Pseudomonas sp. R5(2019)]